MKHNFTNEDFEELLRRNADEFRMRPSLKVWQNISSHLKERRRIFLLTTLGFVLMTSAVGYFVYDRAENINTTQDVAKTTNPPADVTVIHPAETQPAETTTGYTYRVPSTQYPHLSVVRDRTKNSRDITPANTRTVSGPLQTTAAAENTEIPSLTSNTEAAPFEPQVIDSDPVPVDNSNIPSSIEDRVATDPMTIESVVNTYRLINRNSKLAMQVFFTPTVSYRKLSENKNYTAQPAASNGTNYPAIYSINDAVTHKPDMGLELGLTAKYTLDKRIRLRGGLQFNVSRYDIKAYTYTSELTTLALSRGGSGSVEHRDEISNYRNFDGNRPDWLQNMYFQVSAPLGLEMKLSGNDRASFGVASTLQPSYMLGERAYMLSSDYKNYTKVPELVRRWNVATNLETFVSYSTGDVKWQVGPQIRYQLFSSFVSKYPVKEHLFDFGLKVGVSLNRKKTESDIK